MNFETSPNKFWEDIYERPKDGFDAKDESMLQAQYMLNHPEIRALASLAIAHLSRKPPDIIKRPHKVMEEVGRFFTRPVEVLQAEVDETLKKFEQDAVTPDMKKKKDDEKGMRRRVLLPDCLCPHQNTPSIESFYSEFISKSTSASTLPPVKEVGPVTPTIEEAVWQIVMKGFNNALNVMYAARDHDILFDEAFLCITARMEEAVDVVWLPRLAEINEVLDVLLGDALTISAENRKQRLLMANKLPTKVNRLKHNFKGFPKNESYPLLRSNDIFETLNDRKGTYNRYPKDLFGVYLPTYYDTEKNICTSYEPSYEEDEEEKEQNNRYLSMGNVSFLKD